VELVGHDTHFYPLCKHYGYLDALVRRVPLEETLAQRQFDMVIPVGAKAVSAVAQSCPQLAVFPPLESLECCFNKGATMALARSLEIPLPETTQVISADDLKRCSIPYPCVVKPACEVEVKGVYYARHPAEREKFVSRLLGRAKPAPGHGVLVQEFIAGSGVGFFGLFDHGRPKRIFMHQRIREYPITGGASTAAGAYDHPVLKEYGLRILSHLRWHGVAMVEFKREAATNRFVVMEINPKFWGSLELSLEAGVNFGADLIRVFRGESLEYSDRYNRQLRFYWPLDGDLLNLVRTWRLGRMRDYFQPDARTNLGYSRTADFLKALRMFPRLVLG
jgi:predicted ATP-grasp superfamily ATP-dependent carboligase